MKKSIEEKGFTMLEVMLVVAIVSFIVGISVLYTHTSQIRSDLNSQVKILVSYLRLVESNALSGKTEDANSIHFETDSYTLFNGDTYSQGTQSNYQVELPSSVTIQNISLNGGGSDVVFDPPQGETQAYGTIQLHSEKINKTVTININSLGSISY